MNSQKEMDKNALTTEKFHSWCVQKLDVGAKRKKEGEQVNAEITVEEGLTK